jgi:hypothetical protein
VGLQKESGDVAEHVHQGDELMAACMQGNRRMSTAVIFSIGIAT